MHSFYKTLFVGIFNLVCVFLMCIPTHTSELFKKSFQYSVASVWNNIPVHVILKASTLRKFKTKTCYKLLCTQA